MIKQRVARNGIRILLLLAITSVFLLNALRTVAHAQAPLDHGVVSLSGSDFTPESGA